MPTHYLFMDANAMATRHRYVAKITGEEDEIDSAIQSMFGKGEATDSTVVEWIDNNSNVDAEWVVGPEDGK